MGHPHVDGGEEGGGGGGSHGGLDGGDEGGGKGGHVRVADQDAAEGLVDTVGRVNAIRVGEDLHARGEVDGFLQVEAVFGAETEHSVAEAWWRERRNEGGRREGVSGRDGRTCHTKPCFARQGYHSHRIAWPSSSGV